MAFHPRTPMKYGPYLIPLLLRLPSLHVFIHALEFRKVVDEKSNDIKSPDACDVGHPRGKKTAAGRPP
jgi:hypothetical protein